MAIMSNYTNLRSFPFPVPIGAKIVPFMASMCCIIGKSEISMLKELIAERTDYDYKMSVKIKNQEAG